jgi:hypothetical protein
VIFSRGRGAGKHAKDTDTGRSRPRHARPDSEDFDDDYEYAGYDDDDAEGGAAPEHGPYDADQAPAGASHLDLGSLKIPVVEGVEVRVQAGPEGAIQQVVLVHRDSALQISAFAAPRTAGIWDEVRAEIHKSLSDDGVAAEEVDGEYGPELRARVRSAEGVTELRFVGIDGPRWMVRGVYQGVAAVDPNAAERLAECLRGLVVERGQEAKPVREALPLRLPRELAEQVAVGGEPGPVGAPGGGPTAGAGRPSAARVNGAAPGTGEPPGGGRPRRKPSPHPRRAS